MFYSQHQIPPPVQVSEMILGFSSFIHPGILRILNSAATAQRYIGIEPQRTGHTSENHSVLLRVWQSGYQSLRVLWRYSMGVTAWVLRKTWEK